MTKRRDFKAKVRARMAVTGEKYTVALAAIRARNGMGDIDFDGTIHINPRDHEEPRADESESPAARYGHLADCTPPTDMADARKSYEWSCAPGCPADLAGEELTH